MFCGEEQEEVTADSRWFRVGVRGFVVGVAAAEEGDKHDSSAEVVVDWAEGSVYESNKQSVL